MKTFTCFLLLAFLSIISLRIQAQTASRLVAWAAYNDFYINDSAHYTYTGSNGGDLTHLLNYSNETIYGYNPNPGSDSFYTYEAVQESFNSNGTKSDSLTQYWDSTTWVNWWRTLFNYDANNHDTLAYYQMWDSTKWIGSIETFYHYSNNKIDTMTIEDTSYKGGWVGSSKYSYAYDPSGYISDEVIEYWNLGNNTWFSFYNLQFHYSYNSFNNDTAFLAQDYDTAGTGTWVNDYELLNTFDANHNIVYQVELGWDTTVVDTITKTKIYYKYDANSNDTSDVTLSYNYNTFIWDTVATNSYIYNTHNQVTYHSSYNADLFLPYSENKYYYEDYTAGLNQVTVDNGKLTVYPNPSSGFIHLTLTLRQMQPVQLYLYNVLGQQVWSADMGNAAIVEATIPVTNLVDGVYVLKANSGNISQQKEIVVAR